MVGYRRAIGLALAGLSVACAGSALIDTFDVADVPGAGFFSVASPLLVTATWIFLVTSARWRTPRATRTGR